MFETVMIYGILFKFLFEFFPQSFSDVDGLFQSPLSTK